MASRSLCGEVAQIARRLHRDGEAFRAEKVADPLGAADQHRGLGIGRNQDEDPVLLTGIVRCPMLDFMRRLPKRQLAKRDQCRFAKEVLSRARPFRVRTPRRAPGDAAARAASRSIITTSSACCTTQSGIVSRTRMPVICQT